MELDVDSFNRLSLGLIEKFKIAPDAAIQRLAALKLNLVCGEAVKSSIPLQAALVTAVNTAKRAFLGGVHVQLPANASCLLPWPGQKPLADVVTELGGIVVQSCDSGLFTLTFGLPGSIDNSSMQVVCNEWQGGVLSNGETFEPGFAGKIPTAGIFAGGLGVGLAFLRSSGISIAACDQSVGLSLWRPDLPWLAQDAKGPEVALLPAKYWLLGLGHLGQAYLWNIGLLPYGPDATPQVLLQDFDKVVSGNWSAGLLCELSDTGYKTRLCSRWLETRGFETIISERHFDEHTKRSNDEPFLALCGFDNRQSRHFLEGAGFDLVVEAGLGSSLQTFDFIATHIFPNAKTAKEIWPLAAEANMEINEVVLKVLNEEDKETCGIVPLTIAGKSLSASFVGACAGSLAVAELLRALNGGVYYDKIVLQLRNIKDITAVPHKKKVYTTELSRNGWVSLNS